jgi:predicted small lipoprotein YifL
MRVQQSLWSAVNSSYTHSNLNFRVFIAMRKIVLLTLSVMLASVLGGCGQSGALTLASDPNYDQRPSYLLYHANRDEQQAASQDQATDAPQPVAQGH